MKTAVLCPREDVFLARDRHVEFDWGTTEYTEHAEMNAFFRVFRPFRG